MGCNVDVNLARLVVTNRSAALEHSILVLDEGENHRVLERGMAHRAPSDSQYLLH